MYILLLHNYIPAIYNHTVHQFMFYLARVVRKYLEDGSVEQAGPRTVPFRALFLTICSVIIDLKSG